MSRLYANNAATTLNGSITSGQTSITILNGSAFPAITGSDTFFLTLENVAGTAWEIVLVTAHSEGGTSLTVVRGQDGTAPAAWPDLTLIERRVVAQEYSEFVSETDANVNLQGNLTVAGAVSFSGAVDVPSGGTGLSTITSGAILRGNGTADIDASLTAGLAGDVVATTDGDNWTSTPIATMVTKAVVDNALALPLEVPQGGTGLATVAAGSVLIGDGTGALVPVAPGTSGSVLTSTGTAWASTALPAVAVRGLQKFTASGVFTVPAGVTKIWVTASGGGGAGYVSPAGAAYSGEPGNSVSKESYAVTPAATHAVTIGGAGATTSVGALVSVAGGTSGGVFGLGYGGGPSSRFYNAGLLGTGVNSGAGGYAYTEPDGTESGFNSFTGTGRSGFVIIEWGLES